MNKQNPASIQENEMHKLLWNFEIQTDHRISARRPVLVKDKRFCRIVDFAVLADDREKLKESEKRNMYLNLARERKKLWNMKKTVIQIAIGALSKVTKGMVLALEDLEIRGQEETIQSTVLLRSVRIMGRVLETCRDLLSLRLR